MDLKKETCPECGSSQLFVEITRKITYSVSGSRDNKLICKRTSALAKETARLLCASCDYQTREPIANCIVQTQGVDFAQTAPDEANTRPR